MPLNDRRPQLWPPSERPVKRSPCSSPPSCTRSAYTCRISPQNSGKVNRQCCGGTFASHCCCNALKLCLPIPHLAMKSMTPGLRIEGAASDVVAAGWKGALLGGCSRLRWLTTGAFLAAIDARAAAAAARRAACSGVCTLPAGVGTVAGALLGFAALLTCTNRSSSLANARKFFLSIGDSAQRPMHTDSNK